MFRKGTVVLFNLTVSTWLLQNISAQVVIFILIALHYCAHVIAWLYLFTKIDSILLAIYKKIKRQYKNF